MSIINESTSILQLDTSGLQNGASLPVYVSSTTIPGQLVTVIDATGYLSSPQSIVLSSIGTARSSGFIQQRFGYITIISQDRDTWTTVNCNSFPTTAPIFYRALDAPSITTTTLNSYTHISTLDTVTRGIDIRLSSIVTGQTFISSMNINSYQAYLSTHLSDSALRVWGYTHVNGSTTTLATVNVRGALSSFSNVFAGSISSKTGTISVGGNISVQGNIQAQSSGNLQTNALSSFGTASFNGYSFISSVRAVGPLTGLRASTLQARIRLLRASDRITLGHGLIENRIGSLKFSSTPIVVPSITTQNMTSSNASMTSNITFRSFGPASTLQRFDLSAAQIANAHGSLHSSSIAGSNITLTRLTTKSTGITAEAAVSTITLNDDSYTGNATVKSTVMPLYWSISSIGTNGQLNGPQCPLATNLVYTDNTITGSIATQNNTITDVALSSIRVTSSIFLSSVSLLSLKGVHVVNAGGSLQGVSAYARNLVTSSIQADYISSPSTITFYGESNISFSTVSISSLVSHAITTSSLTLTGGTLATPLVYSTINSTAAWLQASTATVGLGTYFDPAVFNGQEDQTTYFSVVNPLAKPSLLSTLYINTIAGTGSIGYSGDGGPASQASIGYSVGQPAIDSQGNLFFGGDTGGWKLRKINTANIITTVCGLPQFFYGDGQYPTAAALGPKLSVSVIRPGRILITDASNVRLRYVDQQPVIQTIAGTGQTGYSGDGGLAFTATFFNPSMTVSDSAGNIFVADTSNNMIRKITAFSTITRYAGSTQAGATGDGGPALSATLAAPYGVATDSANLLYITDMSNCVVRTVDPATGTIQRIAGDYTRGFSGDGGPATSARLAYPRGIATDAAKNVYVADTENSRVRKIDYATGIISTIAGNGVEGFSGDTGFSWAASLSSPRGVATDSAGNLYIADTNNNCIRFVDVSNQYIQTVAGIPPNGGYNGDNTFADTVLLSTPTSVAYDPSSGFLYISDDGNQRIRLLNTPTGIIYDYAGNGSPFSRGDQIPASNAVFGSITGVVTDPENNLYIADGAANIIRKIDMVSGIITSAVGTGGGGSSADGPALTTSISNPRTLVRDANDAILFCDADNHRIRKYIPATGIVETIAGTGQAGYSGDSGYAVAAQLNFPKALALDSAGNIFIGDSSNYRIRRIDAATGIIRTYAGTGVPGSIRPGAQATSSPISFITALNTDNSGSLYMTDLSTNGVWRIGTGDTTFQQLSATGSPSYIGYNVPLSNARFNQPTGLIADASGNFLVVDSGNYLLRRTYTFGIPQNPTYITLHATLRNYYATEGTATISINGNTVASFTPASSNSTFSLSNTDIFNYPLEARNPVLGDLTPYILMRQTGSGGYLNLTASLFVTQLDNEGLLQTNIDPNAGLVMNSGILRFPNRNNGITIDNRYNDISTRNLNYTGSLLNASDPALKEQIQPANLQICYDNLSSIPLRTYSYSAAYQSTFHTQDRTRLGFLTSEVSTIFPHSITSIPFEHAWAPSTVNTLDLSQIKYSHLGATQILMQQVSSMEAELGELQQVLRRLATQRNVIH